VSDQPTMGLQSAESTFDGWGQLDWRQRRERRFRRWLNPAGVEFANDAVRAAYQKRVRLVIDALELSRPARVPVCPMMGLYTAKYGGLTVREAMYDYEKLAPVWRRFHEDFLPDFQAEPIVPGRVFDLVGGKFVIWPGHGVADDAPWQYVEAEYMKADEYDALIADPSAYFMRSFLPRIAEAFEHLAVLDPFTDILEAPGLPYSLIPFADPAVLEGVRKLAGAAQAMLEYLDAYGTMSRDLTSRLGLPLFWSGLDKAPYDILADTLRGTRGIARDRYRQPGKILAAVQRFVPLQIDSAVRQMAASDSPLLCIPLHKGADGFMSDADFREFYWPTLKEVALGLIDEGIVPVFFAEGGYNDRLPVIADPDLPAGSVVWWFDATDMVAAKRALGGYACIGGNVPGGMLALGSGAEVEEYVTALLDGVAGDGGFILGSGVMIDHAKPETLKALIQTGRRWACR
jgi:hypothetical protein